MNIFYLIGLILLTIALGIFIPFTLALVDELWDCMYTNAESHALLVHEVEILQQIAKSSRTIDLSHKFSLGFQTIYHLSKIDIKRAKEVYDEGERLKRVIRTDED